MGLNGADTDCWVSLSNSVYEHWENFTDCIKAEARETDRQSLAVLKITNDLFREVPSCILLNKTKSWEEYFSSYLGVERYTCWWFCPESGTNTLIEKFREEILEASSLLGCYATSTNKYLLIFRRVVIPPSSGSSSPGSTSQRTNWLIVPEENDTLIPRNVGSIY